MTVKSVLTVALDVQQELAQRVAGPVFTDAYTDALINEVSEVIDALERDQEDLASRYLTVWSQVATRLSDERNIELFVNLDGADDDGQLAEKFRIDVASLIGVHLDNDVWRVTTI